MLLVGHSFLFFNFKNSLYYTEEYYPIRDMDCATYMHAQLYHLSCKVETTSNDRMDK